MSPPDAWELTWGECLAILRAREEERREDMRFEALCAWKGADLTAQMIAPMLARGARRTQTLQQAFPALYEERDSRPEWMRIRDKMLAVAENVNTRFTRQEE